MFCRQTQDRTCARHHAGIEAHCVTNDNGLSPVFINDEGILVVNDSLVRVEFDKGHEVTVNGSRD